MEGGCSVSGPHDRECAGVGHGSSRFTRTYKTGVPESRNGKMGTASRPCASFLPISVSFQFRICAADASVC